MGGYLPHSPGALQDFRAFFLIGYILFKDCFLNDKIQSTEYVNVDFIFIFFLKRK